MVGLDGLSVAEHRCPEMAAEPKTVADLNQLACDHNCPLCGDHLRATNDEMYCPAGCYERPLNENDPVDLERREDASERYWLGKWSDQ